MILLAFPLRLLLRLLDRLFPERPLAEVIAERDALAAELSASADLPESDPRRDLGARARVLARLNALACEVHRRERRR